MANIFLTLCIHAQVVPCTWFVLSLLARIPISRGKRSLSSASVWYAAKNLHSSIYIGNNNQPEWSNFKFRNIFSKKTRCTCSTSIGSIYHHFTHRSLAINTDITKPLLWWVGIRALLINKDINKHIFRFSISKFYQNKDQTSLQSILHWILSRNCIEDSQ